MMYVVVVVSLVLSIPIAIWGLRRRAKRLAQK